MADKEHTVPPGIVHIVGAGPGPSDLLTLRALDRIRRAEVVVHDRLIAPDVLALAPTQARRVYVGKASGHHVMSQRQIHTLLIEQARQGRRVVRLKGGDPFVFGRGGEEVQALQEAGIAFEVVPGITAANGCASTAGIPLTHRDLAHSCTFLPGHLAEGSTELDWHALTRPRQTRVFYMGIARVAAIARQLIAHGLAPETPAAIVLDGTRQTQTVLATGLAALARQAPAYGQKPGLVLIGETVALSPHYRPHSARRTPALPLPNMAAQCEAREHFSATERDSFYRVLAARRDMRHFAPGTVDEAVLQRLLEAAHAAPSVGLMQPWRFVRVTEGALRGAIYDLVQTERAATAAALGDRGDAFMHLKVEGIRDCAELLVAVLAPDDGTLFGRRTLPQLDLASVACAIQNLWLAARAENLGLGWVSLFDPAALAALLHLPPGARPVAILCLGPVAEFYPRPMLELAGWRPARPLADLVYDNRWPETP